MPRHHVKKKLVFADQRREFVDATAKKRRKIAAVAGNGTDIDQNESVQAEIVKSELLGLETQLEIIDEVIGWGFMSPEQETQRTALDAEHNVLAVFGPPTTGKTSSVTKVCKDYGIEFVTVNCQEWLKIGKTAAQDVKKLFENAKNKTKTDENTLGAAVILISGFNRLLDFTDSRSAASVLRTKVCEQINLLKPIDRVKVVIECQKLTSRDRLNLSELGIGNINFETCAAICHVEGNTIKSGHYFCWRKYEDLWHKVNDDQIQTSQKKFIANLENVYALVLRRQN